VAYHTTGGGGFFGGSRDSVAGALRAMKTTAPARGSGGRCQTRRRRGQKGGRAEGSRARRCHLEWRKHGHAGSSVQWGKIGVDEEHSVLIGAGGREGLKAALASVARAAQQGGAAALRERSSRAGASDMWKRRARRAQPGRLTGGRPAQLQCVFFFFPFLFSN
jgi:hypothetical protein